MKILFVIPSLRRGGTERQLSALAPALADKGHSVTIITLVDAGAYADLIERSGCSVINLGEKVGQIGSSPVRRMLRNLVASVQFVQCLREGKYDLVHGFGRSANYLAAATKWVSKAKIVWGIRDSGEALHQIDGFLFRLLSRWADLVISNSLAASKNVRDLAVASVRIEVIPNGIDMKRNRADLNWGREIRKLLGISETVPLVGSVGRLHHDKNHPLLLTAAQTVIARRPGTRFVIIGSGDVGYALSLQALTTRLGLAEEILWVPEQPDIEKYLNALDVFVSASISEGFSNVIAEAMAIGVPCVVTDVGDSAAIVGQYGQVVPSGATHDLANAIVTMIDRRDEVDRLELRHYVSSNFGLGKLLQDTEDALLSTLQTVGE